MALETDLTPLTPAPVFLAVKWEQCPFPWPVWYWNHLQSPGFPGFWLSREGVGAWPVSQHPANHSIFGQSPGGRAEACGRSGFSAPSPSPRQGPSSPLSLNQT